MACVSGKTGEIVKVAGNYRAYCGAEVETSYFTVGDTFTPCRSGGEATWSLIHG